jgi:hypothetical protein
MSKELLEKIDTVLKKDQQLLNETIVGFDPHNKISLSIDNYLMEYVKDLAEYLMRELKVGDSNVKVFKDGSVITTEAIKIGNIESLDVIMHVGVSTDYPKIRGVVIHGNDNVMIDSQTPNATLTKIKSAIKGF